MSRYEASLCLDPTDSTRTQSIGESGSERIRRMRLRVVRGPDTAREQVLEERTPASVGSAKDNELCLADPTVSRYHLDLQLGEKGLHLRDLGSSNGTYVAGIRVVEAVLHSGVTVGLGKTLLLAEELQDGIRTSQSGFEPIEEIVGESPSMKELVTRIRRVAPSDTSVLIQGETGTGKEVIARSLHRLSRRAGGPFEVVDCGAMPANLIASELFGHERGAFTGAPRRHIGAFERAHGGTLFLDEIGELPLEVQPVLLGALERRTFRRVGGERELAVDVRVVAATHRDLREAANAASFRGDLYYRLAVARLSVPPLRDRPSDIPALVRHFVRDLTGACEPMPIDQWTLASWKVHRFPGNVRELRNLVESAIAFGAMPVDSNASIVAPPGENLITYRDARSHAIAQFEREYLSQLMAASSNNASEAARRAQMDRPYLLTLLRKHGLR